VLHESPPASRLAAAAGAPPHGRRLLLALPYVGLHSYRQKEASAYGPGLRFGGLFGVRVIDQLSLSAELTVDHSKINQPVYVEQDWYFRVSLSPIVHVRVRSLELALGPKLGFYSVSSTYDAGGARVDVTDSGYATGVNAGVFTAISTELSIGLLLAFDVMWSQGICVATAGIGIVEKCGPTKDVGEVLGVTAGLLF